MPTIFTHAAAACALGAISTRRERALKFWAWAAACAVLPDADVVGFAFGVSYGSMFGHRGLSHSLAFAVVAGCAVASLAFREARAFSRGWWGRAAFFAAATASHGLLDALTDGGLGVAFFAPFVARRYFFPWRPIEVSPIGAGFFSVRGVVVFENELVWVWLPSAALVVAVWGVRKLIEWRAP